MGKGLLIIVVGFSIIFGNIRYNLIESNKQSAEIGVTTYEAQVAHNTAASAATMAISQLSRNFLWRSGYDSLNFTDSKYSVWIEDQDDDSTLAETQVRVTAIADFNGVTDSIIVILYKPSFSRYSIFSNKRPSNMYLITGDTLWGPMHTNTRWNMSGYPVFYGKVTSVASYYQTYGTTDPRFYGGTDLGIAPIEFPLISDVGNYLTTVANNGGDLYNLSWNEHLWLTFHNDGTYEYKIIENGITEESGTRNLADLTDPVIMANGGNAHVKGDVCGQVTIGSTKNIYIEDDLKYANDPRINPNSTDLTGLVSLKDIIIQDNVPNRSNCEIHGSLMAFYKGIKAQNYDSGSPRGNLIIVGGYIVEEEQPTGTFYLSGGHPVLKTGYQKKYHYDERLLSIAPPYFPIIQKPEVFSWWE